MAWCGWENMLREICDALRWKVMFSLLLLAHVHLISPSQNSFRHHIRLAKCTSISTSFWGFSTWGYQQHFTFRKKKKLKFDFSHSNLAMQFWCWKINYNSCMQKNCWMKWASADGDGDGVGGGGAVVSIAICCLLVVVLLLNIVVFFGVVYVVCQIRTQNFWMMKNEHRTTDVFRQIFSASRNQKTSVCYL